MATAQHFYVDAYVDFWRAPTPERLGELMHDQVVLRQPLAPPLFGLAAARKEFEQLWAFLPDLRARVQRWNGDDKSVFIEIFLSATIGSRAVEWNAIDRFILDGPKATERTNYFDPIPLLTEFPRHPSAWPRWWRSGSGRPWQSGYPLATRLHTPSRISDSAEPTHRR